MFLYCASFYFVSVFFIFSSCSAFNIDKLDEILAAAQHTITPDNQGQRGHGGKRDRSKSIVPNVSNEVLLGKSPSYALRIMFDIRHSSVVIYKILTNAEQPWITFVVLQYRLT